MEGRDSRRPVEIITTDNLRAVSERAAWHEWIEYFLLGVARMSEDALSRATRINDVIAQWLKKGWPVNLTPCESLSCYQPTRLSQRQALHAD